jgi:hypothetical protein
VVVTLANLKEATEQQVFDQVAKHMLAQGVRSKKADSEHNVCLYRGPAGLKCAAGCLIADDEYTPEMDNNHKGTSWDGLVSRGEVPRAHRDLIQDMQSIHDRQEPEDWKAVLKDYAANRGLAFNE